MGTPKKPQFKSFFLKYQWDDYYYLSPTLMNRLIKTKMQEKKNKTETSALDYFITTIL